MKKEEETKIAERRCGTFVVCVLLGLACGPGPRPPSANPPAPTALRSSNGLVRGAPDEVGMDARPLIDLATWVRDGSQPIFSLLISRNGVLVYELYTSSLHGDEAH